MENNVVLATPEQTKTAASDFAHRINDAVTRDDSKLYSETMTSISDWTKLHSPINQQEFDSTLLHDVDLKPAALYETKQNFSRIDLDKNNAVNAAELYGFASRKDANVLQETLLKKAVEENITSIASNEAPDVYRLINENTEIKQANIEKALKEVTELKAAGKYLTQGVSQPSTVAYFGYDFLGSNKVKDSADTTGSRPGERYQRYPRNTDDTYYPSDRFEENRKRFQPRSDSGRGNGNSELFGKPDRFESYEEALKKRMKPREA